MKIQLTYDDKYPQLPDYLSVDLKNLSILDQIHANTCEDIHCNNALDMLPYNERQQLLENLLNKLTYEGGITVVGLDILQAAIMITKMGINTVQIQEIIYSLKSADTLHNMVDIFHQIGLVVLKKKYNNIHYKIHAKRMHK